MGGERCWRERCRKAACGGAWHIQANAHLSAQRAASMPVVPAMAIPARKLRGHLYERANICAECGGELFASDGHYHSRRSFESGGAEPICCPCSNKNCVVDPLVKFGGYGVPLEVEKGEGPYEIRSWEEDEEDSSTEEQQVSKTSQNKKVQEAMKGQKAAKASKNGATPRVKKERPAYVYTPMPANFKGNVVKVQANGKIVSPVHKVEDGKTLCGYGTTEQSKGDKHYNLQFVASKDAPTCKRCTAEPKAAPAKKPTPITAKAKKAAAATS